MKRLYKRDPYHSYFGSDLLRFPVDPLRRLGAFAQGPSGHRHRRWRGLPRPLAEMKRPYKRDPYHSYFGSDILRFPVDPLPPAEGLSFKDRLVIVTIDGEDTAISLPALAAAAGTRSGFVEVTAQGLAPAHPLRCRSGGRRCGAAWRPRPSDGGPLRLLVRVVRHSPYFSPASCCGRRCTAPSGVFSLRGARRTVEYDSAPLRSNTPLGTAPRRPRHESW